MTDKTAESLEAGETAAEDLAEDQIEVEARELAEELPEDEPGAEQTDTTPEDAKTAAAGARALNLGVKVRLFLAFGCVALLTVIGSVIAWLSYANIESSLATVVDSSMPAMNTALELAAESAFYAAAAPVLGRAETEAQRREHGETLREHSATIDGNIERLSALGVTEVRIAGLGEMAGKLAGNIDRLDTVVGERLQASARREAAVAEVAATQTELLLAVTPLVDDANFTLVLGSEEATTGTAEVIDRLVNKDVTALRSVLEIQAEGNLIAGLLGQALALRDGDLLGSIEESFVAAAQRVEDALAGLPEEEAYAEVRTLAQLMLSFGRGEQGVFTLRRAQLTGEGVDYQVLLTLNERLDAIAADLAEVHKAFLQSLSEVVDTANFDLVVRAEDAAKESTALVQNLVNEGVAGLRALLEVSSEVNLLAGLLTQAANVLDAAELQPLRERFNASEASLANAREALTAVEGIEVVLEGLDKLVALGKGEASLFALRQAELDATLAGEEVLTANLELSDSLKTEVDALVAEAGAHVGQSTDSVESAIDSGRTWMLGLALVSLLFAGLIAWLYVGRNLVRRLVGLAKTMEAMAAGNLQVEVPAGGNDEVAAMARTLHVFRDGLLEAEAANRRTEEERRQAAADRRVELAQLADTFESSVMTVVEDVSGAAGELRSTAEGMSDTVGRARMEADGAAGTIEEASSNVSNVASAAEELTASIRGIAERVAQSAEYTKQAASKAQRTNAEVEGLAEAADKIGEVVRMISEIAEQTNLLALNATIEAARAGEAGRGFAVVAAEVKALANQTGQATQQIEAQIGEIQTATRSAVQEIREITETVEHTHRTASEIAEAIEQQDSATGEISRNVQDVAAGTAQVSDNIGSVAEATQQTGAAAENVLTKATDLASRAGDLRGYVEQFLSKVRAA